MTVALELALDDELLLEGRGYDLIRQVNRCGRTRASRSPTASS